MASSRASAAYAQSSSSDAETERLKSMSVAELGNVVVTIANKQPEEVWKTPAAVFVLTHEDIRRSGALELPELLRLVPGVQVSRIMSDQWVVGVRGLGGQYSKGLLVLIDGRSVYTMLYEGVYWDVQDLPLDDIDHIEVIRGPGGAAWGENAVNGVINIITKHAADTQGLYVSAFGGGVVQRFDGVVRDGWTPRPDLQVRAFGKAFNRGAELNPGNNPYDDWHQARAGFRMDWQPNNRNAVMAEGDTYLAHDGFRDVNVLFSRHPSNLFFDGRFHADGGHLNVRWDRKVGAASGFSLQGYYDRTYRESGFLEARNTFDLSFVGNTSSLPRQDLTVGGELYESPDYYSNAGTTVDFLPHHLFQYVDSAFVQDRIALVPDRLSVVLGSKVEVNNYTGAGFEPTARLLWNPTQHQAVWASVSRALRIPGRIDRDLRVSLVLSSNPPILATLSGDPHFKPEVLTSWEAGYRRLLGRMLYADLALFHNDYNNLESYADGFVITHPTQPYPYTDYGLSYANGLEGMTDGLEVAPDFKPASWIDLRATFSHLHINLQSKAGFHQAAYAQVYEQSSPHDMGTLQMLLTLPHRIEIDPDWRYMSALRAVQAPAYQTADMHLAWRFTRRVELSVDGRNLLQPSHPEYGDNNDVADTQIRRSIYGGIRWIH